MQMRWSGFFLIFAASLCLAASRCPDPRLRQASIGGDTIRGGVVLHKKPLKFAPVRIYFSSSKTAWVGTTDKNGIFTANELPPGKYRLEVGRWGSTTIQINPDLHRTTGNKIPLWGLWLSDNSCVLTSISY
jgi:hypothetical protein